jgi:hypothetical protein
MLALTLAASACGRGEGTEEGARMEVETPPATERAETRRRPVHVDSVFPIEEEIRRFRATLDEQPTRLRGGASSRDSLVARFIRALERRDSVTLAEMHLSAAEFGYLYYPYTRYTREPYELKPALLWFQIQNASSRGITRALRDLGGRSLGYVDYRCEQEPEVLGEGRSWSGCRVRCQVGGNTVEVRLFGSIFEREGHYKFISYANDL